MPSLLRSRSAVLPTWWCGSTLASPSTGEPPVLLELRPSLRLGGLWHLLVIVEVSDLLSADEEFVQVELSRSKMRNRKQGYMLRNFVV